MNIYSLVLDSGDSLEIEADFYQSEGPEYVFIAGSQEVARTLAEGVVSLTKTPLRAAPERSAIPEIFI